jgi:hypothetical protein
MIHGHEGAKIHAKGEKVKNYTLQIEWDGGGVEDLRNPEWRMKGDEPDKQGKISHRDAKVSTGKCRNATTPHTALKHTQFFFPLFFHSASALLQVLGE